MKPLALAKLETNSPQFQAAQGSRRNLSASLNPNKMNSLLKSQQEVMVVEVVGELFSK